MYHCDENLLLWWNIFTVIRFVTMMIYHIYHMVIWGLLTKLTNFAFLQIANFGHFDTCWDGWLGGWVGWKSRLKTISAQLKLKLRAELGNRLSCKQTKPFNKSHLKRISFFNIILHTSTIYSCCYVESSARKMSEGKSWVASVEKWPSMREELSNVKTWQEKCLRG